MPRVIVGAAPEFPDGQGVAVRIGDLRLAVFRIGNEVFAIRDRCSHRGFPLHDGTVVGACVRCRTHGALFDLRTGAPLRGPARRNVPTYPACIIADQIEIELPG